MNQDRVYICCGCRRVVDNDTIIVRQSPSIDKKLKTYAFCDHCKIENECIRKAI